MTEQSILIQILQKSLPDASEVTMKGLIDDLNAWLQDAINNNTRTLLSLGNNNSIKDVAIGDIANHDIVKVTNTYLTDRVSLDLNNIALTLGDSNHCC